MVNGNTHTGPERFDQGADRESSRVVDERLDKISRNSPFFLFLQYGILYFRYTSQFPDQGIRIRKFFQQQGDTPEFIVSAAIAKFTFLRQGSQHFLIAGIL